MKAFVGELSSFDWFDWACKAGLCKPGDEVTRCVLDIGIDQVVTVYIGKHVDGEKANLRFPVLANVRDVEQELNKAIEACKAALEAFQQFSLCDMQEDGLDEEGGTKFGYVVAEAAEERLVKQLTEAVGEPSKASEDADGDVRDY